MNTKSIGNIGELRAITKLYEMGLTVSLPYGDNARFDFIVGSSNLLRIQVKTSNTANEDYVEFYLQSSQAHRGRGKESYSNDIDAFILVDLINDKIFFLDQLDRTSIKLRYNTPKGVNQHSINYATDYSLDKILEYL